MGRLGIITIRISIGLALGTLLTSAAVERVPASEGSPVIAQRVFRTAPSERALNLGTPRGWSDVTVYEAGATNAQIIVHLTFDNDGSDPYHLAAYDLDGDPAHISDAELESMRSIVEDIADYYSPWRVRVTTSPYSTSLNAGATMAGPAHLRVRIGNSPTPMSVGGFASGTLSSGLAGWYEPQVYVFPAQLGNSTHYIGCATAHEIGHALGLQHQHEYDANGVNVNDYFYGDAQRAPIMGGCYYARRALWWRSVGQDDRDWLRAYQVIAQPDDVVDAAPEALVETESGVFRRSGVIGSESDVDRFTFSVFQSGPVTVQLSPPSESGMLDAKLEVYDAISRANLGEDSAVNRSTRSLTLNLNPGDYEVAVRSQGNSGDVGRYSLVASANPGVFLVTKPRAPDGVTARWSGDRRSVQLRWAPVGGSVVGYRVERSLDGGKTYQTVGQTKSDTLAFTDTVKP